jgi:hypothetical protein
MLKPPETSFGAPDPSSGEEPLGDVFHRLVEDGKAYAQAEAGLWKTIASEKAKAHALPAALLFAALLFAQGAVTTLCVALFLALLGVMSPFLAGVLAFLIASAVGGILAWLGMTRIRRIWR